MVQMVVVQTEDLVEQILVAAEEVLLVEQVELAVAE